MVFLSRTGSHWNEPAISTWLYSTKQERSREALRECPESWPRRARRNGVPCLAAAVEATSEHPLAKAIVEEARRRGVPPLQAANFEALCRPGSTGDGRRPDSLVGGPRLIAEAKVTVPPEVEQRALAWASEGKTVLYVIADGRLLGALATEDEIRPESLEAVAELHRPRCPGRDDYGRLEGRSRFGAGVSGSMSCS